MAFYIITQSLPEFQVFHPNRMGSALFPCTLPSTKPLFLSNQLKYKGE
jgi:hypothetical protein